MKHEVYFSYTAVHCGWKGLEDGRRHLLHHQDLNQYWYHRQCTCIHLCYLHQDWDWRGVGRGEHSPHHQHNFCHHKCHQYQPGHQYKMCV